VGVSRQACACARTGVCSGAHAGCAQMHLRAPACKNPRTRRCVCCLRMCACAQRSNPCLKAAAEAIQGARPAWHTRAHATHLAGHKAAHRFCERGGHRPLGAQAASSHCDGPRRPRCVYAHEPARHLAWPATKGVTGCCAGVARALAASRLLWWDLSVSTAAR